MSITHVKTWSMVQTLIIFGFRTSKIIGKHVELDIQNLAENVILRVIGQFYLLFSI